MIWFELTELKKKEFKNGETHMVPDIMIKGLVASYLTSPQGMEMIHNYISSSAGQASIRQYLKTPRGKQIAQDILPLLLDVLELPDDVKNSVRENLGKKK